MAAVLAAILAAFLAGAIALFREYRLEVRRLRIAARVMESTFIIALASVEVVSGAEDWATFDEAPGREAFERVWEAHRDVLAGHLNRRDWDTVQAAARNYLLTFYIDRDCAPNDATWESIWGPLKSALKDGYMTLSRFCS